MKEMKRNKRINKYDIRKHESIAVVPKKTILLTHNLSTNISITDLQYIHYSNEVGCQKNKINSNIRLCKPTSRFNSFNGFNQNLAVKTESTRVLLSRSVQVVPNSHAKGDFFHRNWKENYRSAEINIRREYVNLKTSDITYTNRQQNKTCLTNKTPLLYPDVNFHVMSMVLPHLNESLHRNFQCNNVQNKTNSQSTYEENTEKNSKSRNYTYTNGFVQPMKSTGDYFSHKKEENLKKNYYNNGQKDSKIKELASKTSKCSISCETDISGNFEDMMEIINQMKIFLDSKKNSRNKSSLKQSELFSNEIIEVKYDDSQLKSLSMKEYLNPSMETDCSIPKMKIFNEYQKKRVDYEEDYTLKNNNETINKNGNNYDDETNFVKNRYPLSTDKLHKIEEAGNNTQWEQIYTKHEKPISKSVEEQYSGKYSSNDKKLKKQNYRNQCYKKQLKILLKAKNFVSSTDLTNDIFNSSTQELLWRSNSISEYTDYQKTNLVNYKTNNVNSKILCIGDNQNINSANCISTTGHKENNLLFKNKIRSCKDLKDEMETLFSKNESTPSSTYHVPQTADISSEYSKFNLRGPYCRNYYVYYSECIPYTPVVLSEIELSISHMHNRIRLMKCIQFFSEQYKCLDNIAQSILLMINMMEKKVSGNENTFSNCFSGVCAIQKLLNHVVSINKLIKTEILLQNHVKINRNILPPLQDEYEQITKFQDQCN